MKIAHTFYISIMNLTNGLPCMFWSTLRMFSCISQAAGTWRAYAHLFSSINYYTYSETCNWIVWYTGVVFWEVEKHVILCLTYILHQQFNVAWSRHLFLVSILFSVTNYNFNVERIRKDNIGLWSTIKF